MLTYTIKVNSAQFFFFHSKFWHFTRNLSLILFVTSFWETFCFCIIFAVRTFDSKYFDLVQKEYILNFRQIDNSLKRISWNLHHFLIYLQMKSLIYSGRLLKNVGIQHLKKSNHVFKTFYFKKIKCPFHVQYLTVENLIRIKSNNLKSHIGSVC